VLQVENGNYLVGRYIGIVDENGYDRIHVQSSDRADASPVSLSFDKFSSFDGLPTVDEDVEVGDVVLVRVFLEAKVYEVGKKALAPTGEWKAFITRKALRVSRAGA
jgi:hypothetical protein